MSVQLIAWAYEQKTGSPTEKAVLLALCNAANHHTGLCRPKIARLAEETEFGESTVRKALESLVEKGIVARERPRRPDGTRGTYRYSFPHLLAARQPALGDSGGPALGDSAEEPEVVLEPEVLLAAAPQKPTNGRARNPVWDALAYVFGEPTTPTATRLRGKITASLTQAGATHDQIVARASAWPAHFDSATLTETALEKHWSTLARKPLRRQR